MKDFIIQKFGGTSVGFPERLQSLKEIVKSYLANYSPILIVSAVSGFSKNEGTTSLLLNSIESACKGESFSNYITSIRDQHIRLLDIIPNENKNSFIERLDNELTQLSSFLNALITIGEKSPKSIDFVLSFGERLSALLVTEVIKSSGINVRMCDLSRIVSENFNPPEDEYYNSLSRLIIEFAKPIIDEVLVVTGFFGFVPEGILNKVGRGYSDLTAALVARGLGESKVKELQIWKEVDGVFSADPRKVSTATVLSELSAAEAVELSFFGSEVIHPHTMEQVISKNIPIRVLNSLKPEVPGTLIRKNINIKNNKPSAVTVKKGITVLSVTSNRMYDARGFLANLFEILRKEELVVDLVSTSEVTVSCTVNDFNKLKKAQANLEKLGEITILENRAILAVVGRGLSESSNSIGKMFSVLSNIEIYPEMITQAETRTSISCVVKESEVEKALTEVHNAIFN